MPPKRAKQTSSIKSPESQFQYPAPFDKAFTSIEPFLAQLDPSKVYITHIDRHTPEYKKFIFSLTVLVNVTITALLTWRVYAAAPKYFAIGQTLSGRVSSATVDTENTTSTEQIWILFQRTAMFVIDYLLVRLVVPWPYSFFFERPANPVTWRWKLGFQKQEVVVRVCRNWEAGDMMKGEKKGEQSPFFKTRIQTAIDKETMEKTGYLMMDGSWDLDFGLMQDAHTLVKQERVVMQDLDTLVLVHMEGTGWLAWRFGAKETDEDENRRKMLAFKDMLTKMGKESLFWKWQEIVEDERSKSGGFTPEAQTRVAVRVEEEFAKEGVDFQKAIESIGEVKPMNAGGG